MVSIEIELSILKKHNAEIVCNLDLPDALKAQLASHYLTIEQSMDLKTSDLAEELGMDPDAAGLIINAIRL